MESSSRPAFGQCAHGFPVLVGGAPCPKCVAEEHSPAPVSDDRVFGIESRPPRTAIHMATAVMWSLRAVCQRNEVGCVLTSSDMRRVLSIGYNGPAKGLPVDSCNPNPSLADRYGCGCLHAEMNAVAAVDSTIPDKIAFVTVHPCRICAQLLAQANVVKVFYSKKYRDQAAAEKVFAEVGVHVEQLLHHQVVDLLMS